MPECQSSPIPRINTCRPPDGKIYQSVQAGQFPAGDQIEWDSRNTHHYFNDNLLKIGTSHTVNNLESATDTYDVVRLNDLALHHLMSNADHVIQLRILFTCKLRTLF